MTKLVWGEQQNRKFQTGLSQGVLYPPGASGVPWNGLVDITETLPSAPTPLYLDGVKFADRQAYLDYSAKLKAFTYPDELDRLTGVETYGQGLSAYGQRNRRFGLSYRTVVGDGIVGAEAGYKIHMIYNAVATVSARGYSTISNTISPESFEWDLDTKPLVVPGFRPTAHFEVDSTKVDDDVLLALEAFLYGTDATDAALPGAEDLMNLFAPGPAPTAAEADGSWSITGDPAFFVTEEDGGFAVKGVKTIYADEDEYTMPTED